MLMLSAISEFFIKFWITMNSLLYHVATLLFEVFLNLASFKLVDSSRYQHIIQNFYVILGVVMLFILAFSILKAMINPDDQASGTSVVTKIVKNLVISTLILAVLPTIFTFAFDMQNAIIHQNTLGQLLGFGGSGDGLVSEIDDTSIGTEANKISNAIFTAFLYPADFNDEGVTVKNPKKIKNFCEEKDNQNNSVCIAIKDNGWTVNYAQAKTLVDQTKEFGLYKDFAGQVDDDVMDFNYLLSLFGGLFLLYVIVSFCFDLGIRLVKLVFYQIIAPIPVFLRVVPNGKLSGVFDNWVKVILTVYLEVFIRLLVVYFVVFICREVNSAMGQSNFGTGLLGLLTKAFVYMGLIAFMKQAPAAIAEVTGLESGNMKLGIKDKLASGGAFAVGAIAGGAITAGTRNASSAIGRTRQKYYDYDAANDKWTRKAGVKGYQVIASGLTGALKSTTAGTISGAVRSGRAGMRAGSFSDMKNATNKGSKGAVDARLKRENYRAAHSSGETGVKGYFKDTGNVIKGHFKDARRSVSNYVSDQSVEGLTRESQNMSKLAGSYNTFSDGVEALLEKEQAKGDGSVFYNNANGFNLSNYAAFDQAAKDVAKARADFSAGKITADALRLAEGNYSAARDNARDELMNMMLKGSKDNDYLNLSEKGKAALKDGLVNAENLKATVLENANSRVVQDIMGANGALEKIANNQPLDVNSFVYGGVKLKDSAKVAQAEADIKIAEMNKENAAKGDKQ